MTTPQDHAVPPGQPEPYGEPHVSLARDLGLVDVTMIGVGAMIGAGIFVLTGIAAGHAGPALILAFLFNGLIAALIGSAYAELGSCFPEAGGGYLWVKQGMSNVFGFLSGWMSWSAHAVACSLYGLGFGAFAAELLRMGGITFGLDSHWVDVGFAVVVILLFTLINFRGTSETGLVGNIVTGLKVFILLVLAGFGLVKIFGNPQVAMEHYTPFLPEGFLGVAVAMGLTFIAFEGYEIIAQSGEEIKDPGRNIPRAIFWSIVIAVFIYLLIAFVVLGALTPPEGIRTYQFLGQLGELGMAEAANQFMPYGKVTLLLAGLASTMSALNATIYSSSRVSFAMGRDGNLPTFFGRLHPVKRTPHLAIFVSSALIVAMAIALPIEQVAASADIMFLLLFMMVCYTVITLRERRPDLDRQFKMPWVPVLPWIGILLCVGLSLTLIELGPIPWLITIAWIVLGLVLYFSYSTKQQEAMAQAQRPIILEEVVAMRERSIMVPVADVGQARSLGELGASLAVMANAELFALHVVRVPQALSMSEGRVFLQRGRDVLDVAIEEGRQRDVPVHTMIRLGRNIAHTIMATARQRDADLILLGWPGYSHSPDVAFGSIIDLVGQDPPADVAVVRFRRPWEAPQRIMIPARGGGPNIQLAFELARSITNFYEREENGSHQIPIHALFINTAGTKSGSLDRFRAQIEPIAEELGIQVDIQRHNSESVVAGILEMTGANDLLLMGATEQRIFEQRLFGTIPEQVMRESPATIIMCKRHIRSASLLRSVLLPEAVDLDDPTIGGIRKESAKPATKRVERLIDAGIEEIRVPIDGETTEHDENDAR